MRPVRRGASPQAEDFDDYRDAKRPLVARLGGYCSYCERKIVTQLAVEHIQPKGLPRYAHLIGRWDNLLLACVNCNATKADKDVVPEEVLLPDRDNTYAAYVYSEDGSIQVASGQSDEVSAMAERTLALVGLDKAISAVIDDNGKRVAIDRVGQRKQAWLLACDTKQTVAATSLTPQSEAVRRMAVDLAEHSGFFSIWMTVFDDDLDMRRRLVGAFAGTAASGCFDPATLGPISPAPNPDALRGGGKS